MECLTYCIASSIDLPALDNYCKTGLTDYVINKSRDVLKLSSLKNNHHVVFAFKNGTLVCWGIKRYQIAYYLHLIKPFADKLIPFLVHDEFSYQIGAKTKIEPHEYFEIDCLTIDSNSDELKLGLSYGFSQSVKLQYFESIIENLIEKYNPMIQRLSNKGKMPLSRRQMMQVIGEILGAKSELNLISNFLYLPKYFWQHPTLDVYYTMIERYLDVPRRVNAINHQLDTLNEVFDMFNDYLENRHSHALEIIIILLIIIEIAVAAFNFHF